MIQSFRERLSGTIAVVLITLIAIPLAFFGVDSLFLNTQRQVDVGKVNGIAISELELERAALIKSSQRARQQGDDFAPSPLQDRQIRREALDDLVVQKLFLSAGRDRRMDVSAALLDRQVVRNFQVDGQFSRSLFEDYLRRLGYTTSRFLESFADELTAAQLTGALAGSGIGTEFATRHFVGVTGEQRSYQYIELPVASLLDQVDASEAEVADYYQANMDEFAEPERVTVDYLQLERDQFLAQAEVDADELQQRLDLLRAEQEAPRREVAHILIEESDEAQARLEEAQAQLEAGEDFAALAEELSEDAGSAANGGYLGFTNGSTFPAEFEAALAELEPGQVSPPVLTDAGYHLIKLLAFEQDEFDSEAERATLEMEIKREQADELYVAALEELREAALATDDLQQLAEEMQPLAALEIQTSPAFERDLADGEGEGIAAEPLVRAAAYSPIVLEDRLNSEALELSNTTAVVLHLNRHQPAGIAPLEQVQERIIQQIKTTKATAMLSELADKLAQELTAGADLAEIAEREDLQWQTKLDQLRPMDEDIEGIEKQIFAVELTGPLPQVGTLIQPAGGYLVYRLEAVKPGSLADYTAAQQQTLRTRLGAQLAAAEFTAYTETLRKQADIDIRITLDPDADF
ncbi:MAG: SurA N-terminal domain-containing protein [Cellvibrionales bacterium]|nr:SurA N-terminal domain-containing protein [Cellvibrionales bacterium]